MYEILKHLIINADTFRDKMRIGHYPQIGGKKRKVAGEWENNQRALWL